MMYQQLAPAAAFAPFLRAGLTFVPYCDAGGLVSLFHLTITDCLEGLQKAIALGWVNFATFDVADYEYHEQVRTPRVRRARASQPERGHGWTERRCAKPFGLALASGGARRLELDCAGQVFGIRRPAGL